MDGSRLSNVRFADDIVLFARKPGDLQTMLQALSNSSRKTGLTMNMDKTKVMINRQPSPIQVDSAHLQYIHEYIYLGQLVSFKQTTEKELKRRIAIAWRTFWPLKFILLHRNLNRRLRFEALESCIFPALLFGCQTWKLAENQKKRIQVCQKKMERKILGISLRDRIPNARIRALPNTADAVQRATTLKWKWGGHLARLHMELQMGTASDDVGSTHRGRPATRWAGEFKTIAGVHWSTTARRREDWKK